MAWTYWRRTSPRAAMPAGQWTMSGSHDTALVHLPLPPAERACCRPPSSPTGSCCGCGRRRSRRCARSASATGRSARFHGRTSLIDPVGPPSLDAPLSESTTTSVSSSSPSSLEERRAPDRSGRRRGTGSRRSTPCSGRTARWSSPSESHAGTQSGRGDSSASRGTTPSGLLALEGLGPPRVPAPVEVAAVALEPVRRAPGGASGRRRWRGAGRTAGRARTWRRSATNSMARSTRSSLRW